MLEGTIANRDSAANSLWRLTVVKTAYAMKWWMLCCSDGTDIPTRCVRYLVPSPDLHGEVCVVALVAMATGTGKTFTVVNQIYRAMKSKIGTRILFLVDRRALAVQTVRAFASFEPEPGLKFDKCYEVYSQRF